MKKWLYYALVLAAIPVLSFGGFGGQDIGKLSPVQVLTVRTAGEQVQLQTDTADLGSGDDIRNAVRNMNEIASARVFLDTADYLLLGPGGELWLPQLREYLRPSCKLCYVTGEVDLGQVAAFLQLHEPKLTLAQYEAGERGLSCLISNEGRLQLVQP